MSGIELRIYGCHTSAQTIEPQKSQTKVSLPIPSHICQVVHYTPKLESRTYQTTQTCPIKSLLGVDR